MLDAGFQMFDLDPFDMIMNQPHSQFLHTFGIIRMFFEYLTKSSHQIVLMNFRCVIFLMRSIAAELPTARCQAPSAGRRFPSRRMHGCAVRGLEKGGCGVAWPAQGGVEGRAWAGHFCPSK